YLPLEPDEVKPVELPLPDPATAGDHSSAQLLRNAARLNFRSGAGPFRSLGQISVRPRPYQFVPLLMGLRLDRVRLLIADDVGVGKTIEGALIARELLDRGEVTRLAIICPPHLCDQWQQELVDKFQLPAEVIRSGTIAQLERRLPPGRSVFEHFPVFVTSIDFVKSGRYYSLFLSQCPDLVIVDEAHTCTRPPGSSAAQQQRHNLVRQLADRPERHMILLTATPHSGLEEQFRSLLGLLKPEFEAESFDLTQEDDRKELARHFVQRRRADVRHWLGADTKFPRRDASEEPYSLSADYRRLFDRVFEFAREIVKSAETLTGFRQRIRYWTALALLRCVMSSPAAAQAAFQARARRITGDESFDLDSDETAASLFDPTSQEANQDNVPTEVVDQGEATFSDSEVRRLREFSRQVAALSPASDTKFSKLTTVLEQLLAEGRHPIVYCRFIPTSNYVAERLKENSGHVWKDCRIVSITGERSEDERTEMVEELHIPAESWSPLTA
ncbi:MAG: SNF2-related protein, partial [candidate division WOR-3 bacterium]